MKQWMTAPAHSVNIKQRLEKFSEKYSERIKLLQSNPLDRFGWRVPGQLTSSSAMSILECT